jgi:hypothetical protein
MKFVADHINALQQHDVAFIGGIYAVNCTEICTTAFQGCGWLVTDALSGFEKSDEDQVEERKSESGKNKESKKQK